MNYDNVNNTYSVAPKDNPKDKIGLFSEYVISPTFIGVETFVFTISHHLKIVWSIVKFISIYMVNNFVRVKIPADAFFSHYPALFDVTVFIRVRMCWEIDKKISTVCSYATSPVSTFLTFLELSLRRHIMAVEGSPVTPMGAIFLMIPGWVQNIKVFVTRETLLSKHWFVLNYCTNNIAK